MNRFPVALLAVMAFAGTALAWAGNARFDPVFRSVVAALHQKCALRPRLPARVPDLGQGREPIYAVIGDASARRYTVYLAFTPDCNGASFCRIATFAARPAAERPEGASAEGKGTSVRLAGGRRGMYVESECGANCSDAEIRWREGSVEYLAGVKGGSRADAVRLANACL